MATKLANWIRATRVNHELTSNFYKWSASRSIITTSLFFAGFMWYIQGRHCQKRHQALGERLKQKPRVITQSGNYQLYSERFEFPWIYDLADWQGRKIEIEGYFKPSRFIVARQKNGKDGYLILAPFVTYATQANPNSYRKVQNSIIVCLGWVPKQLKNQIQMGDTPLPLTEFSQQTHPDFLLWDDGFSRDPSNQGTYVPLTKITGVLRPGEKRNILKGLNNWPTDAHYKFIDLFFISRYFRHKNIDSSSIAYIDRVVQSEQQAATLPIPQTVNQAIALHEKEKPDAWLGPKVALAATLLYRYILFFNVTFVGALLGGQYAYNRLFNKDTNKVEAEKAQS